MVGWSVFKNDTEQPLHDIPWSQRTFACWLKSFCRPAAKTPPETDEAPANVAPSRSMSRRV